MKEFVMWVMLGCFFLGIPLFYIGLLIEKTQRVANFFKEKDAESKLGERLSWIGGAALALGFLLLFVVYPKL